MKKQSMAVLAIMVALGCRQDDVTGAKVRMVPDDPRREIASDSMVDLYWHPADYTGLHQPELWVIDRRPEFALNILDPGQFSHAVPLDARIIRYTIYWQPTDHDAANAAVTLQSALNSLPSGRDLLVVVHNPAVCSNDPNGGDINAYASWVTHLVQSAAGQKVHYWELGNEEDNPANASWLGRANGSCGGNASLSPYDAGRQYALMLAQAYPAIKSASPGAWVLIGGLATQTTGAQFLQGVYDGQAAPYFDFVAVHSYGTQPEGLVNDGAMNQIMWMYGDERRPMWNTEFGAGADAYPGPWPHASLVDSIDAWQTRWWTTAINLERQARLYNKIFGFSVCGGGGDDAAIDDSLSGTGYTFHDVDHGLLRHDCTTHRPAYDAVANAQYNAIFRNVDSMRVVHVYLPNDGRNAVLDSNVLSTNLINGRLDISVRVRFKEPTRIKFTSAPTGSPTQPDIEYRAYLTGYGWTDWVFDSVAVGTDWGGAAHPIQAIQLRLQHADGVHHVYYHTYSQAAGGWGTWIADGPVAGTIGYNVEAFSAYITGYPSDYHICYYARVPRWDTQNLPGWLSDYVRCDTPATGDGNWTGWSMCTNRSNPWLDQLRIWLYEGALPSNWQSNGGQMTC